MDKETLSNYGWIVICVLVLAVMIALATPFGSFVADAVKSTTQGLFDVNKNALNSTGLINIDDNGFADGENGDSGNIGGVNHNGPTIPDGATYTKTDGTVLNAGDAFPTTPTTGDKYLFGNYEYCFGQGYFFGGMWMKNNLVSSDGWGVRCTNDVTDPGLLLSSINGKPLVSMEGTFYNKKNVTNIPVIPNTVQTIRTAFNYCPSLTQVPTIPESVIDMFQAFQGCHLTGTVEINANIDVSNSATYTGCFGAVEMRNITLTGSASKEVLNAIGATGNNWTPIP